MLKLSSVKKFFTPYAIIFTIDSPYLGIFLALTSLLQPNLGIGGFLGLFFANIYLHFFNSPNNQIITQSITRNCILIGLLVGDLFAFNLQIILFLAILTFLTLMVSAALKAIFLKQSLPVLSLPFCIVSPVVFLLMPDIYQFSHAPVDLWTLDISAFMPEFMLYFFHSLGSLLCFTNPSIGLIFWIGIIFFSPLAALFLLVGFFIGTTAESIFHITQREFFFYGTGLNYSLVFSAIAGVFMSPSRLSILIATLVTIATSAVVAVSGDILNPYNLPILSLPFNLVLLLTIVSLRILKPSVLNFVISTSPEKNIENSYLFKNRFRPGEVGIFMPVEGEWQIQQAFNGELTHRGNWKHALDFVAIDQNGKNFANNGLELSDHFAFGKTIISPIDGTVISCFTSEKDNLIGQVSNTKNWGNYIIIRSFYGHYITMAHLKEDSICVAIGSIVKTGQKIAQCGNSGYSQEPHLHIQAQLEPWIGAATIPFHLINYSIGKKIHFHRTPELGDKLQNLTPNHTIEKILNFKIAEELKFQDNNKNIITITSQIDEMCGRFYLSDKTSKVYYSRIGLQFYFYGFEGKKHSPLFNLVLAAPRIVITYGEEFEYSDHMPAIISQTKLQKFSMILRQMLRSTSRNIVVNYKMNKQGSLISGTHNFGSKTVNSALKIDPALGIQEFSVGNRSYVRI